MLIQFSPYGFLFHVVDTTFDGAGTCVVLETVGIILVPVQNGPTFMQILLFILC